MTTLNAISFAVLVIIPAPVVAQSPRPGWKPLIDGQGTRVEISDQPAKRTNGSVILWLRWDLASGSRDFGVEWNVERTELDCPSRRSRVLESRRLVITAGAKVERDSLVSKEPAPWREYAVGSLGAQVLGAACQHAKADA